MNNRDREHLLEEYDDAAMMLLMDAEAAAEGEALWKAYEQSQQSGALPQFPEELDDACRKMIRDAGEQQTKILFLKRMGIWLKRVAVFVVVFLCLASSVIMTVDAIKVPVLNYFFQNRERYSSIVFDDRDVNKHDNLSVMDWVISVPPPVECELTLCDQKPDGSFVLEYKGNNGIVLHVKFFFAEGMISFDSEDIDQVSMKIYDYDGIYVYKRGPRIFWFDSVNKGVFDVKAENLDEEVFWKYVYRIADFPH